MSGSGKTKIVLCFYCKKEFEVNVNVSTTLSICQECKEKGLKSPSQIKATENRNKKIMEKYGVSNISQLQLVKDKKTESFRKRLDNDPEFYKKIHEKRIKTLEKIFGPNWKEEIQKLKEQAIFEKYGVSSFSKTEEFSTIIKKICENRTEEEWNDIIKKIKASKLEKYGDENFVNREKTNQTNIKKYGGNSPTCNQILIENREIKRRLRNMEKIKKWLFEKLNIYLLDDYISAHTKHRFKCGNCGFEFEQIWNSIQQGYTCPNCRKPKEGNSKPELELRSFIESFEFTSVSYNNRALIYPWELDIVIHDIKLAIEYCGLFYHHEKIIEETRKNLVNPKLYHSMKKDMCNKLGYKLITIFEDEWIFKKEIVLGRLKQIMGKSDLERIHGRKCIIQNISTEFKNNFLDKFHIQGRDSSDIKLGAFFEENLVAVMTFSKGNISKGSKSEIGVWELNRFCTDNTYIIPGVAGKLLGYFKNNYEWFKIYSYTDLRWSDNGNMYRSLGFKTDEKISLNYWYIDLNKVKRIHRFELRKKEDDPKDIPEWVLRSQQGYYRIWDCGNLKFILEK